MKGEWKKVFAVSAVTGAIALPVVALTITAPVWQHGLYGAIVGGLTGMILDWRREE